MSREDFEPLVLLRKARKELKNRYGAPCPACKVLLPKAHPSILLPGQRCRIHGYVDDRPRIDQGIVDSLFKEFGLERQR